MSQESSAGVTSADVHAYLDDELLADQAATVAEALRSDMALCAERDQIAGLREVLHASFDAVAHEVPSARFEQVWDEIDRAIERDVRLQADADRNASIWTRLGALIRPARIPVMAAAAATVVTVIVMRPSTDDPANHPSETIASATPASKSAIAAAPDSVEPASPTIAEASPSESTLFSIPIPATNEAEIHGIEFGGRNGRISQSGTVTVLYVEDDGVPSTNERSL